MFIFKKHISRRTALKGAGVTLALPFLDAMVPAATALAQTAAAPKIRAGFFYIPHGAVQHDTKFGPEGDLWTPKGKGADFKLNKITASLEPFKKYVTSIGNLENLNGSGVHTRNPGTWLNCQQNATTIDQLIAKKIGQETAMPSLELASETNNQQAAGSGTATTLLSFRDANTALPAEYNPKKIFNELFGATTPKERVLNARESDSLLDMILERTKTFQAKLGPADRARMEEYLESVREIERRTGIIAATDISSMKIPERPVGVNDKFDQQVDLMFDLLAIAYQADITRVATYLMVAEGTNQTYNHVGVADSFHPISHHANEPDRIARVSKIQTWHMERFANFLQKMASTKDGDGTLLDHSVFMYGSNMGNSDKHSNWPIPTIIVGGGNGKLKQGGQHIDFAQRTPLSNVLLTVLHKFGIEQDKISDSTGVISEI
jgi:Protein of unknown function (DUF1552)